MTPNLIDTLSTSLSPKIAGAIGRDAGAVPNEVSGAIKHAAPSVVAGMVRSASTEAGAAKLLDAARGEADSGLLEKVKTWSFSSGEATELGRRGKMALGTIFGGQTEQVIESVARSGNARPGVVERVLGTLAPIALALVGKEARERGLGPREVMSMLASERRNVLEHPNLPPPLAGILGLSGTAPSNVDTVTVVETPPAAAGGAIYASNGSRKKSRWGFWAILAAAALALIAIVALVIGGVRSARRSADVESPSVEERATRDVPPPRTESPRTRMQRRPVPRAEEPIAPVPPPIEGPTSETTITGAEMSAGVTRSMNLRFQSGTTQLEGDDAPETLRSIVDQLKQNPEMRVRLEGHADPIGKADENEKLALRRANAVKKMLVDQGIDERRIDVGSAGERKPSADNTTPEGRASNRRVEVTLLPK